MVPALDPGEDLALDSTVVQEFANVYNGGTLMQMVIETTVDDGASVTETLSFSYDANGNPYTFSYTKGDNSPSVYHYVLNLQGDVVRIVTNKGVTRVTYEYDAWGNITNMTYTNKTLADANPLRYRGYYYDQETGLYYLQSRYYNPQRGRFINADSYISTGQGILGNNMFAYCRNNPVIRKDTSGTDDECVVDFNEDNNPLNDLGSPSGGGGGIWGSFMRTLKYATDGLKMASGQRNLTYQEDHHLISDKHKTRPIGCKEIIDRYDYSLDHESNIVPLKGHRGRHTNAYHDFITIAITELDVLAAESTAVFIDGMKILGEFVQENWWIPYARRK